MEATVEAIELEAIVKAIKTKALVPVPNRNQEVNNSYIKLKDTTLGTIPLKSSKSLERSS